MDWHPLPRHFICSFIHFFIFVWNGFWNPLQLFLIEVGESKSIYKNSLFITSKVFFFVELIQLHITPKFSILILTYRQINKRNVESGILPLTPKKWHFFHFSTSDYFPSLLPHPKWISFYTHKIWTCGVFVYFISIFLLF